MKSRVLIFTLLIVLSGCTNRYFVPDDFPKEDFFSYIPYLQGDVLKFASTDNAIKQFTITALDNHYVRGNKNCDCGKETVSKYAILSNDKEELELWICCTDRAIFEVSLKSNISNSLDAKYETNYTSEDIWSKSYDNTKIFDDFTDNIILSQSGKAMAQIAKNEGIVCFSDTDGETWRSIR